MVPTILLRDYCTTGLQLCYASVAQDSAPYLMFHRRASDQGDLVILDHSPTVPRKPVSPDLLVEMVGRITPSIVVLPNMDFTPERTVSMSERFISDHQELNGEVQLLGVVQGYDMKSLRWCYNELSGMCDLVGLPASNEKIAPRSEVIDRIGITEPVVYLEVYRDPTEELPQNTNVVGTATSWPARLGCDIRTLDDVLPTPPPMDFHIDSLTLEQRRFLDWNLREYRARTSGREQDF